MTSVHRFPIAEAGPQEDEAHFLVHMLRVAAPVVHAGGRVTGGVIIHATSPNASMPSASRRRAVCSCGFESGDERKGDAAMRRTSRLQAGLCGRTSRPALARMRPGIEAASNEHGISNASEEVYPYNHLVWGLKTPYREFVLRHRLSRAWCRK